MGGLFMWNIFDGPGDYPGFFVVRRVTIIAGSIMPDRIPWAVCDSLEAARAELPPEANIRIVRSDVDVDSLVETWF